MANINRNFLIRTGRILDALKICREQLASRDPEICVEYAELLHRTGELEEAERCAADLEVDGSGLSASLRARCAVVRAACLHECGRYEQALDTLRRALSLAESARDAAVCAIAASQLLERSAQGSWKECIPLASEARRYAIRAGDPHIAARVHLSFGRLEGRAGHFDTADRHFVVARQLLEGDSNLWIGAAIDLDDASVVGLIGDYQRAVEIALRGAASASMSGWAKGQALAAANLGYFYIMLGQETEALRWIKTAPHQFRHQPGYRLAIAETLAQAEFAKGHFEKANSFLDCPEFGQRSNQSWYDLSCHVTRSRIMLARGDWINAQLSAESGLSLAREVNSGNSVAALTCCRTEALAAQGIRVTADDLTTELDDRAPGELLASTYVARGKALMAAGDRTLGSAYIGRGVRVLQATGSAPARVRAL